MARKTKTIVIDAEGRDRGKTFLITEMPAMQAEKWAARALLALGRSGAEVPEEATQAGASALLGATLASFRQVNWIDAEPLFDEMLACVQVVPDPSKKDAMTQLPVSRALLADDIEETATLVRLRSEVVEIHTGFSVTAVLSTLGAAVKESFTATSTSRKSSARSSGRDSRRSTKRKPSTA